MSTNSLYQLKSSKFENVKLRFDNCSVKVDRIQAQIYGVFSQWSEGSKSSKMTVLIKKLQQVENEADIIQLEISIKIIYLDVHV